MSGVKHSKNLKHSCRVCLSEDKKMFFLDNLFNEDQDDLSILQVLEIVMSVKIKLHERYPCVVCTMCLKRLNMAYNLKNIFDNSQKILQEMFSSNVVKEEEFIRNDLKYVDDVSNYTSESGLDNLKEYDDNIETIYIKYTDIHEDLNHIEIENSNDKNKFEYAVESEIVLSDDTFQAQNSNPTNNKKRKRRQSESVDVNKYIIDRSVNTNYTIIADEKYLSMDAELIKGACNLQFKCPACPKFYTSKRNLEKHKEGCKKLKCTTITYPNNSFANLKSESLDNSHSLLYECDKCSLSYPSVEELDKHRKIAHNPSDPNFMTEVNLEELSEIDQELFKSALLLKYKCDSCPKVYSSFEKLNRHKIVCKNLKRKGTIKSQGRISSKMTCPLCEKNFQKSGDLLNHIKNHQRENYQFDS